MGKARSSFKEASASYRGTGVASPDYGGVSDQGIYQANVCLVGEGKKPEATLAFRDFIQSHPYSPLVMASYRRLVRLNGGTPRPQDEKLVQTALNLQQKRIRMEGAACGPKTVAYLLPILKRLGIVNLGSIPAYEKISKLCSATERGTSVEDLREGLRKLGVPSYAFRLNRRDLARAPMPAILLSSGHYLGLLRVDGNQAVCYDSRFGAETRVTLPPEDDPDYVADVIVFSVPELSQ